MGFGGGYQSRAVRGPSGVSDTRLFSGDVFADYPFGADAEAVFHATAYRNDFGSNSRDTGWGYFADAGYRYKAVMPYVSYEAFSADECDGLAAPACTAGTQESSIVRGGLHFYINKNANHIDVEYSNGRSLTTEEAPRINSVLVQWNAVF